MHMEKVPCPRVIQYPSIFFSAKRDSLVASTSTDSLLDPYYQCLCSLPSRGGWAIMNNDGSFAFGYLVVLCDIAFIRLLTTKGRKCQSTFCRVTHTQERAAGSFVVITSRQGWHMPLPSRTGVWHANRQLIHVDLLLSAPPAPPVPAQKQQDDGISFKIASVPNHSLMSQYYRHPTMV
jgi:hypothetical protein